MSYILDALKKAEAQRNMGAAPDLHAQPAYIPPAPAWPSAWTRPWPWVAVAAAAAALAALALLRPWESTPQASAPPAAPAPVIAQAAPVPVPAPASEPAPVKEKAPPPAEPIPAPKPKQEARPKQPVRAAAPKPPAEPKPAPEENRIATLRELPENIQREIPTFTISGYLYSGNKSDRTVLINQKLVREGDQVAPDLLLEKLTPTGMVLNYKGHRYRRSY